MATGETHSSLSFSFRISKSWIGRIITEVLRAIKLKMFAALPAPTKETFTLNGIEFGRRWNFPNVMGCLDGKHIRVRCPRNSGSLYFNYKDFFSIVLFALVGPNYEFIAVDIGSFGREGDAGIFNKCQLGRAIRNQTFDTPGPAPLPGSDICAPHIFLGDEAFALLENLLKPYPREQSLVDRTKAIFNYRLSRARRIVENAFGLLTQNFRIYLTPIDMNIDVTEDLVTVTCILHNMIIKERGVGEPTDVPPNNFEPFDEYHEIESDSRKELKFKIRDTYREYFNTIGSVPWQNETFRL